MSWGSNIGAKVMRSKVMRSKVMRSEVMRSEVMRSEHEGQGHEVRGPRSWGPNMRSKVMRSKVMRSEVMRSKVMRSEHEGHGHEVRTWGSKMRSRPRRVHGWLTPIQPTVSLSIINRDKCRCVGVWYFDFWILIRRQCYQSNYISNYQANVIEIYHNGTHWLHYIGTNYQRCRCFNHDARVLQTHEIYC